MERIPEGDGWTYGTAVMRSYREAMNSVVPITRWTEGSVSAFPVQEFMKRLSRGLRNLSAGETGSTGDAGLYAGMLPFFAWFQRHHDLPAGENSRKKAIELALDMIAGYTGSS